MIADKNDTCEDHKIEKMYYCVTCKESVCSECMILGHLKHKREFTNDAYKEAKSELRSELDLLTPIEDKFKATQMGVTEKIENLISANKEEDQAHIR